MGLRDALINNENENAPEVKRQNVVPGPNGEMDWIVWNWDDKLYIKRFNLSVRNN